MACCGGSGEVGSEGIRSGLEIASTMHEPLTRNEAGPIGYWNLNEGGGQTVYDLGPNALNGTLGASLEPRYDHPSWIVPDAPLAIS